jgi:hypothetical protein
LVSRVFSAFLHAIFPISDALHLGIFQQPPEPGFSDKLLDIRDLRTHPTADL